MTEPLELHNQFLELDAAYKGAIKDLLMASAPLLLAAAPLVALRKQRRAARDAYVESAAKFAAAMDAKPDPGEPPEIVWERIAQVLPSWAELASDEDHWLVIDRETNRVVCGIVNPVELCSDPCALRAWGSQLVRPE